MKTKILFILLLFTFFAFLASAKEVKACCTASDCQEGQECNDSYCPEVEGYCYGSVDNVAPPNFTCYECGAGGFCSSYTNVHGCGPDNCDGCQGGGGGGRDSCTTEYSLNPASPVYTNTAVGVTFPNLTTSQNRCLALFQDSASQSCWLENGRPRCSVNSGSTPGIHTLQLKYGQSSYYPNTDCGYALDCNSTTYEVIPPTCGYASNLAPSGTISRGSHSLTWTNAPGATKYGVRIDDRANGWTGKCGTASATNPINTGDLCQNDVTSGSVNYTFQEGHSYYYFVNSYGECNTPTDVAVDVAVPTPTLIPPTLGALYIKAGVGAVTSGATYSLTGLRSDDPVSPSGSNYYNPITVTQNVAGDSSNISLVGTAFTQNTVITFGSNKLADLQTSANLNKGFILLYANKNATVKTGSGNTTNYNLLATKYYVYYNNTWNGPYDPGQWYISTNEFYAKVDASTTPPNAPKFEVTLYKNLGSRTWGTYGYLRDQIGVEYSASLTPINQ